MENHKIKTLSEYKNDIHRCSKCGLCQAVCPIFKTSGNECTVSRGQFIMLDGVVKGKLQLNKNINKYLDLCLKCNKCSGFCPSEIDVVDILLSAKHEYFKHSVQGKFYKFFESKYIFDTALNFIRFISHLFCFRRKSKKYTTKAVYFGGCISAFRPDVDNYVTTVLNKIGIEVLPVNFNCCGMPFLTTGNIERFIESGIENINRIPDDCDLIITDCASCEWAWGKYVTYIDDESLKNKLSQIRIKNLYDIIAENEIEFELKKTVSVTYHKPCHTNDETYEKILSIIKNIKNLNYSELENIDGCCGFGSYEYPLSISQTEPVRKNKEIDIKKSGADYVLTNCVGCLFALKLMQRKTGIVSRRLISFFKDNCRLK